MSKRAVIWISGDSPAGRLLGEALRVAAGLAVNRRLQVSVFFEPAALDLLRSVDPPEAVDEARRLHLPMLIEHGCELRAVDRRPVAGSARPGGVVAPVVSGGGRPTGEIATPLDLAAAARGCAAADAVMRF